MIMDLVDDLPLQSQETIHQVGKRSDPTIFPNCFQRLTADYNYKEIATHVDNVLKYRGEYELLSHIK